VVVQGIVEVDVAAADSELAADALWESGPTAVSETPLDDGRVRLRADVTDLTALPDSLPWRLVEVDVDADLDAWRAWARPVRVGRHLVVEPAWRPSAASLPGDVVVRIDPGRSFGSGSHPATRLALAALEEHLPVDGRLLDVGCGSGVLAIAGVLLGARAALAVDVDPVAVEVTSANAAANGVGGQVDASTTPVAQIDGGFDAVVANIGVRVLTELCHAIAARVARGGTLVLSGLLAGQADGVASRYRGFDEIERQADEGWVTPVLRRAT